MAVERIVTQITLTAEANSNTLGEGPPKPWRSGAILPMSDSRRVDTAEATIISSKPQVPEAASSTHGDTYQQLRMPGQLGEQAPLKPPEGAVGGVFRPEDAGKFLPQDPEDAKDVLLKLADQEQEEKAPDPTDFASIGKAVGERPLFQERFKETQKHQDEKPPEEWDIVDYEHELVRWIEASARTNPQQDEVVWDGVSDMIDALRIRAARAGVDLLALENAIHDSMKTTKPRNLTHTLRDKYAKLEGKGKIIQGEYRQIADRLTSTAAESEVIEGEVVREAGPLGDVKRGPTPKEIEEAQKNGTTKDLFARYGIHEDPNATLAESSLGLLNTRFNRGDNREWDAFLAGTAGLRHDLFTHTNDLFNNLNARGRLTKGIVREELGRVIELGSASRDLTDPARVDPGDLLEYRRLLEAFLYSDTLPEDSVDPGERQRIRRQQDVIRYNALAVNGIDIRRMLRASRATGVAEADALGIVEQLREDLEYDEERFDAGEITELLGPAGDLEARISGAADNLARRTIIDELYRDGLTMKLAGVLNPTSPMDESQIKVVADNKRATRKLIVKIIYTPMKKKTEHYRLGFYPQNNLDLIEQEIIDRVEEHGISHHEKEQRETFEKKMSLTIEAVQHAHNLHTMLIQDALSEFGKYGGQITGAHLKALFGEQGVATIKRITEGEFDHMLAVDKGITTITNFVDDPAHPTIRAEEPGSYDRMYGSFDSVNGDWHGGSIGELYDGLVMYGSALKHGSDEFAVEEYQREFSKDLARYVYALTLRAPEKISFSEFPPGDRESVARLPMNRISSMFNWFALTAKRWDFGAKTGGQKFVELWQRYYNRQRKDFGWHVPMLSRIRGGNVSDLEFAKTTGSHGFNRSWREYLVFMRSAAFFRPNIPPIPGVSSRIVAGKGGMGEYLNNRKAEIERVVRKNHTMPLEDRRVHAVRLLHDTFLGADDNLRPEFNHSLGVLLQDQLLTPREKDKKNYGDPYSEMVLTIRSAIFRRAAEDNPLAIVTFLNKAEVFGDMRGLEGNDLIKAQKAWAEAIRDKTPAEIAAMETRRRDLIDALEPGVHKGNHAIDLKGRDRAIWMGTSSEGRRESGLQLKLALAQEIRSKQVLRVYETNDDPTIVQSIVQSIDEILRTTDFRIDSTTGSFATDRTDPANVVLEQRLALNPQEQDLLDRIRTLGTLVAPDLATIRWPSTPFINDTLFEAANLANAGDAAFKDMFSEIGAYSGAQEKMTGLIINPANKDPVKEVVPTFGEMVTSLADPLGTDDAQDLLQPGVQAYLLLTEAGGVNREKGAGWGRRAWEQTGLMQFLKVKVYKKGSSWIQYITNGHGPGLVTEEQDELIKDFGTAGVLRKAQYDDLENSFGTHNISQVHKEWAKAVIRRIPGCKDFVPEEHNWYVSTATDKRTKKEATVNWLFLLLVKFFDFVQSGGFAAAADTLKESGDEVVKA